MKQKNKGWFKLGVKQSKEFIAKRMATRKGYRHSQQTKKKIGKANSIALLGHIIPDCVKKKMSDSHFGEKSYLWKGGISKQKGYRSFIQKRRMLRLKNSGGKLSFIEWCSLKEKFDFRCLCCGRKEPEIKLTIDHIIPISRKGKDEIDNIQPLCQKCNNTKYMKHIDYRNLISPATMTAKEY